MEDLIGATVGGNFEIVREIGRGGMGMVYEARHRTLRRRFAIKILHRDLAEKETFVERFRREAIAASRVEHPNIVYITDYGQTPGGDIYLVMEYLEGVGLDDILAREVRLPVPRALAILAQVADALDHAHRMSVVHRDLKPENILLTEVRGIPDVVKILDFGIAKLLEPEFAEDTLTVKGQVFGTAEYMSPEQATGDRTGAASDIYAVGCLAYELLTGDPPFLGPPVKVLRAHVNDPVPPPSTRTREAIIPPPLDALVLRCLAKDPRDRYPSAAELRRDILKVRALLHGIVAEIAGVSARPSRGTPPAEQMKQGWQRLGGKVPELLLPPGPEPVLPRPPRRAAGRQTAPDPEVARRSYHDALRELALALVQAGLASAETSRDLERLLVLEEEATTLTGTVALAEQNFDRIRFAYGRREERLRHAILDLGMERAQLQGRAEADPASSGEIDPRVADLTYQIGALDESLRALAAERDEEIRALDREVKALRAERRRREEEAAQIYLAIQERVEARRPEATSSELARLYARLDELRSALKAARP